MFKRISLIILAVMFTIAAISGCGGGKAETNKPGTTQVQSSSSTSGDSASEPLGNDQLPIVKEKTTIKVMAIIDEYVQDITTNTFTKWLEAKTNVKIDWQQITGSDAGEKVNIVLASGSDLPDMILRSDLDKLQIAKYGDQGMFLPLEDMVDKYGYWYKQAVEKVPAIRDDTISPSGHQYYLAALEECEHCTYSQKMWINQTWLDKLGLQMPKTTEDFYNVLKAFKEKDPNGNGKADEVPLAECTNAWNSKIDPFLMNAFIYDDGGDRLSLVDDKVIPSFTQTEFREGLKYISRLWKEDLIDHESFTQPVDAINGLVMGDVVKLGAHQSGWPNFGPIDSEQSKNFVCVPPLVGPSGYSAAAYYKPTGSAGESAIILKDCKNPEVAFKLADFMFSEEAFYNMFYGVEGQDWSWVKDGQIGVNGKPAHIKRSDKSYAGTPNNVVWGHTAPHFYDADIFLGFVPPSTDPFYIETRLHNETQKYMGKQPKQVLPSLFFKPEDADRYSQLITSINTYVDESIAKFVTGKADINSDTEWNKYLNEFKKMGIDEYVQIVQKTYDARKK